MHHANTAHQDSLRTLIGKVLPGAGTHLIAEAVAAGYGFPTHEAFGEAIRAVEVGRPAPARNFDADRLIGRARGGACPSSCRRWPTSRVTSATGRLRA